MYAQQIYALCLLIVSTSSVSAQFNLRGASSNLQSNGGMPICGVATVNVPAQGISAGCDGSFTKEILHYGYGYDGCSYNKGDYGPEHKTPNCDPNSKELFNIVDEPDDYAQAARDWVNFADKHSTPGSDFLQLVQQGRVTSPGTTGNTGWMIMELQKFFDPSVCPGCNDPSSPRYIGTISFHAYANTNTNRSVDQGGSAVAPFSGNVAYILNDSIPAIKRAFPDKKIALTNFGVLGSTSKNTDQVAFIKEFFTQLPNSQAAGLLDYAYYFAALDVCYEPWNPPLTGCTPKESNSLCSAGIVEALNIYCA